MCGKFKVKEKNIPIIIIWLSAETLNFPLCVAFVLFLPEDLRFVEYKTIRVFIYKLLGSECSGHMFNLLHATPQKKSL